MRLFVGNYGFTSNAVEIKTRRQLLWNAGGQLYAQKISWDVSGYLYANGQAAISAAMAALSVALQRPFQNLVFYDDSNNATATLLTNTGSTTGVRITSGPDFGQNRGSEYSLERHFAFTAEAEYPFAGTGNFLLDFHESLSFSGGGPRYEMRESLDSPPQKQQTRRFTIFRAEQKGYAVGYLRYPNKVAPIWPNDLVETNPDVDTDSPKRDGLKYTGFRTTWHYKFASARPLVGVPNIWKG